MSEHDDRLRELGTELPWDRPDPARRDAVRSSLLVAAAEGDARPRARWYVIGGAFAAGAIAAAAAVLLVVRDDRAGERDAAVASAARIEASPGAQLDREVTRTPTGVDEVVRLRGGTLKMAVGALRAGDHVRVATQNAEVEGEGSYDVVVVADVLEAVNVAAGHATVRVTGEQAVFLSSGQSWHAHAIVAHEVVEVAKPAPVAPPARVETPALPPPPVVERAKPAPRVASHVSPVEQAPAAVEAAPAAPPEAAPAPVEEAPPPPPESPVAPPPAGPREIERHFQSGMALLKAGKAAEAARELAAAADAGGNDPLAADARYFSAVALTKAGRKTEAERALVAFLDSAKTSIRRGRAAVMLARLIAERGDSKAARAWFESALGDADASVVAAARAGIAALR